MRQFLIKVFLFSLIIIGIFGGVILIKVYVTRHLSFRESPDVHYVFIGASHPYHGIDDSLMKTAVNRSATSERYMFSYLKLKEILKDNPQIDTVFLQCASTDLWEHTDDKYFNENDMSKFVPMYFPLFTKSEWEVYREHITDIIPLIAQKSFSLDQLIGKRLLKEMGTQASKDDNSKEMNPDEVKPSLVEGSHGHEINRAYLHKIIDLCNEKGVKLYGVYFPVCHPEYYYDQEQYYSTLKEEFPDLEVLDYHAFELPDSLRLDAHHLNWKGAQRFTEEFKNRFRIR